jgi:tripartite-type tricarboxylate transporter receptor subunit TctC
MAVLLHISFRSTLGIKMRKVSLLFGTAILAFALFAGAQTYPAKPVKMVVPSTPGGSADLVGRAIAQKLSEIWPHPVTVDNRPGAGDAIGVDYVAKSVPDGYTLLMATNSIFVNTPHMLKLPFDVFADFTPVIQAVTVPFLLVVNSSVPARNMNELIAYAKANPDKLKYGSSGNGVHQHLLTELLKRSAGVEILHVPYKGSAQTITDLLAGQVNVYVGVSGLLMPHIKSGRLRAIASAGEKRNANFPDLPTIADAVPGFNAKLGDPWLGLFLPVNTPRAIVLRVNTDIARVLNEPEMKAFLASRGFDVDTSSPEGLANTLKADFASWGRVIREANIKPD